MDKRTLSELGEDYKNFNPSGDGLLRIVQNWGNELSENLRNTLRKNKTNASSVLSQSIGSIAKPKKDGFRLTVEMEDYYKYVEEGRRAGKRPPIESIYEWIQNKKSVQTLISSSTDKRKATRSLAYVIARKIAKHGTKAQPFIRQNVNEKSLKVLSDRIGDYIGKQLAGD